MTAEIDEKDWEDVYNTEDLIRKVHEKYKLNDDGEHVIYEEMADRGHTTDSWVDDRGRRHRKPLIQEQLTKYLEDKVKEDYITDTAKKDIKQRAKKVFDDKEQERFDEVTVSRLQESASNVLQEKVKGEKPDTDKVSKDEITTKKVKETKEYQSAQERIKLNREIVEKTYETDTWRVKQYASRDLLGEVLKKFDKPSHISTAAKELYDTGKFTQARRPMELRQPQTIERDISALRLASKGYTRYNKDREMVLTAKGRKLLTQLEE